MKFHAIILLLLFQFFLLEVGKSQNINWVKSHKMADSSSHRTIDIKASNLMDASYICGISFERGLKFGSPFQVGPALGFVAKLNANGDTIWSKKVKSNISAIGRVFYFAALSVDKKDNIYLIGQYSSYSPSSEIYILGSDTFSGHGGIFILKMDSSGKILKKVDIKTSYVDLNDIDLDINGNAYILGNVQSSVTFGSTVIKPSASKYYRDFIVSYDSNLNLKWAKPFGEIDLTATNKFIKYGALHSIAVDKTAKPRIYVCGLFVSPYTFQSQTFNSNGVEDAIIIKLDNQGNYIKAISFGDTYADVLWSMDINKKGHIAIAGGFAIRTVINGKTYYSGSSDPKILMNYALRLDTNLNYKLVVMNELSAYFAISIDEINNIALLESHWKSIGSNSNYTYLTLFDSSGKVLFKKSAIITGKPSGSNPSGFGVNAICFSKVIYGKLYGAGSYIPELTADSTFNIKCFITYCEEILALGINYAADTCDIKVDLGNDLLYCSNFTKVLDAGIPKANYLWWHNGNNYDTTQTITASKPGIYKVLVSKNGCKNNYTDSIFIDQEAPPADINLGNDTILCDVDSFMLHARNYTDKRQWNGNSKDTGFYHKAKTSGDYLLKVYNGCGIKFDLIHLEFKHKPKIDLGRDTILCKAKSLVLDIGNSNTGNKIVWNNNMKDSGLQFTVTQSGLNYVSVSNYCGAVSDSIDIDFKTAPKVDLGNDGILCNTGSLFLDAGSSNSKNTIIWNNKDTGRYFKINKSGKYFVNISNKCGKANDTIKIDFLATPKVNLGNDTTICPNTTIVLDPGNTGSNYTWMSNSALKTPTFTIDDKGKYWVKVSNACGSMNDTIDVKLFSAPRVNLGQDELVKLPFNKTLDAGNPGCRYRWSTSAQDTLRYKTVNSLGWYWVDVSNTCETVRDSIFFSLKAGINLNVFSEQIKIYPNPATDYLVFEGLSIGQFPKIIILDIYGKEILTNEFSIGSNKTALNISRLNNGMYFYSIRNNNGDSVNGQFIVLK